MLVPDSNTGHYGGNPFDELCCHCCLQIAQARTEWQQHQEAVVQEAVAAAERQWTEKMEKLSEEMEHKIEAGCYRPSSCPIVMPRLVCCSIPDVVVSVVKLKIVIVPFLEAFCPIIK